MKLDAPVVVTPPPVKDKDGVTHDRPPMTLNWLDVTIIDNADRKICAAQIRPFLAPLVLWADEAYTAAGDYTQAQVEARIKELIAVNGAEVLTALFTPSNPFAPPANVAPKK